MMRKNQNFISVLLCVGVFLVLSWYDPGSARADNWLAMPLPDDEDRTSLACLVDGPDLWVGYSEQGLLCYDGRGRIKLHLDIRDGLPSHGVNCLAKLGSDLWIGTSDGLVKRAANGDLRVFGTGAGLPDAVITALTVRDKSLWIGTMKGVAEYRGERFATLRKDGSLPSEQVTALGSDGKGLLIGTTKGWATLRGGAVEAHTPESDGLPFPVVTSMAFFRHTPPEVSPGAASEESWYCFGTPGGGLLIHRGEGYEQLRGSDPRGPGMDWISCLRYEPVNHELWVGGNGGLAVWKIAEGTWTRYRTPNSGLMSDMVRDISLTVEDTSVTDFAILKGFGQECGCASCSVEMTRESPKRCAACWSIPQPLQSHKLNRVQRRVGVATQEGASLLYGTKLRPVGQGNIYCYLTDLGREARGIAVHEKIWAGLDPPIDGNFLYSFRISLLRFEPWKNNPPSKLFPRDINTLSRDSAGNPIAGARQMGRGGLAVLRLASDSWEVLNEKDGLHRLDVSCIHRFGNDLYIGTGADGGGGQVYRLRAGRFETFPPISPALGGATKYFLLRYPVSCIAADNDHLFVGTRGGGIFHLERGKWERFETFTSRWLSSNEIDCLAWRNRTLYVGTKKGLDCYSRLSGTLHVDIDKVFGCPSNEVQALLWDDTDGDGGDLILWLGHRYGLTRVCRSPRRLEPPAKARAVTQGTLIWPNGAMIQPNGSPKPDDGFGAVFGELYLGNPTFAHGRGGVDVCPFDGLPGENINMLDYDDFNLWIATDNGVCRFRK